MTSPFLLVHGAWHGGWCWTSVVGRLQAVGRRAIAPTLPGCAERAPELSPKIGLETFIRDLSELIEEEDLNDLILVGHSAAGAIVPAVAARNASRIRHLVCLDSHMPEEGEALFDVMDPDAAESRRAAAIAHDGGLSVPPPDPSALGVDDPTDAAWLTRMMTPHPIRAFSDPLHLGGEIPASMAKTYIRVTAPIYLPAVRSVERARSRPGWAYREIATGHDAMVSAPDALAELLLSLD